MEIRAKLFLALYFLFVDIQVCLNEIRKEDGVCFYPGSNANTILEGENITFPVPINTLINYRCIYKEELLDNSSAQCLSNGNWSGKLPTCDKAASICKSSGSIEKVIFIDGVCIHFSKQIKLNFNEANDECRRQVNGKIITVEEKEVLTLQKYANLSIHYYWIQLSPSINNDLNDTLFMQSSKTNDIEESCSAITNNMSVPLTRRICKKYNSWICQSVPIGCGYPSRKPVTLMYVTKWKEKFPSEVKYYCPEGFILEGDNIRECKEDGSWSGEAPFCLNIVYNSTESDILRDTKEIASPPDETEHKFHVYIITGIGSFLSIFLIIVGIIMLQRKKKNEAAQIHDIDLKEITSFDSETLVSTGDLYDNLKDQFHYDDDGYVSTDDIKMMKEAQSRVNSDKVRRNLPTLNEECHYHMEDQYISEINHHQGILNEKEDNFVMVENDIYGYTENRDIE